MKATILLTIFTMFFVFAFAQSDSTEVELSAKESKQLMKELSKQIDLKKMDRELLENGVSNACNCVDSVADENLSKRGYTEAMSYCIQEQASSISMASQLGKAFFAIENQKKKKKKNVITLNDNDRGTQDIYQDIERALMDSCDALKKLVKHDDDLTDKSFSENERSRYYYSLGDKSLAKKDYTEAISNYKQAVEIDSTFAFAWDNLGLSYRYKGEYKKAIECYETSLRVDPLGTMPLQNIAVAYTYLEDYPKAEVAYQNIINRYPEDPEGYYGKGRMCALQNKQEEGLDNVCKAYNLYTKQKSPYRADAEKIMAAFYAEMNKTRSGKKKFIQILKDNNIEFEK